MYEMEVFGKEFLLHLRGPAFALSVDFCSNVKCQLQ